MEQRLCIILAFHCLAAVHCQIDQITDNRPFLASDGNNLAWWDGGPSYHVASSSIVRINSRGIFSYSSTSSLRDLASLQWVATPCNLSSWALCTSENGHILPSHTPRMPQDPESMPDGWKNLACADSGAKVLVSNEAYDITACDILDEGLDVIFSGSMSYHKRTAIPKWEYWTLVITGIVLVRSFSYNIQLLWDKEAVMQNQWPPVIATGILLILVMIGRDNNYATEEDAIVFW